MSIGAPSFAQTPCFVASQRRQSVHVVEFEHKVGEKYCLLLEQLFVHFLLKFFNVKDSTASGESSSLLRYYSIFM